MATTVQQTAMQIQDKITLMQIAASLTAISLAPGATESQISTQHERWYQFLQGQELPDTTVMTPPTLPAQSAPTATSPPASAAPSALSGLNVTELQQLAALLAPILATIPGAQTAAAAASAVATAPLPTIGAAATAGS